MSIKTLVIVGLCVLPGVVFAQRVAPKENIRLSVDLSRFRGADDDHVSIEVYYGFPRDGLTFVHDSVGFSGGAVLTLSLDLKDSVVYRDRWLVPYTLQDTASLQPGMNLVGNYTLSMTDGEYQLKMLVQDRNDLDRKDSLKVRFPVHLYATDRPVMSDIEFASSIRRGEKGSMFYKNTLDVIPNVGGLYNETQDCYYYTEAYNLTKGEDQSDYLVRMNVYDAVGKEILSRERPRRRVAESTVLVDQFHAAKLKTGTYTLVVSLLDSAQKSMGSTAKKFFVLNRKLGVDSTLLSAAAGVPLTEYMSMDEAELDREFKWTRWEAKESEKTQFEALKGVEAKRQFLTDFWRRRGVGHREEYLARVAYANANFKMLSREGYRTDRGRVYIVYGPPDDIERHPNEVDSRPYEIWSYNNIQGGVIFAFVMRNQGGDYELVHSTDRNELRDDNWQRYLN
jgi:GWxTD domain-containing protein